MIPRLPLAALLLGFILRVWLYLVERPLWHDEAALALNLIGRNAAGLTTPLDHAQMAPAGFLLLVKGASAIFGTGELALRAVPLLVSLAGLPLFLCVARRALAGAPLALACLLFAVSEPLVQYASELKQYGGDVTAILAIWLLALRAREASFAPRHCLALGAAGLVLPFFSNAVLLGMAGAGLALAWGPLRLRDGAAIRALAGVAAIWTASCVLQYGLFLSAMTKTPVMVQFWQMGFLPMPPTSRADWLWLPERLAWVFELSAGFEPIALTMVAALAGAVGLARRAPTLLAMLVLPWGFALVASALEAYPFFQRFLLFTTPGIAIVLGESTHRLAERLPGRSRILALALGLALAVVPTVRTVRFIADAHQPTRLRPLLQVLSEDREPGDRVYVYAEARAQLLYYAPRFSLPLEDVEIGRSAVLEPARIRGTWAFREARTLAGAPRVWVIFTHVRTLGPRSDQVLLLAALDRCGLRLATHTVKGGGIYLYDLSGCEGAGHSM